MLWGARVIREKGKREGGAGGGGGDREETGGRRQGRVVCPTFQDVCCGLARDLVARMAELEVGGNRKVRCNDSVKLILRFVGFGKQNKEDDRSGEIEASGRW